MIKTIKIPMDEMLEEYLDGNLDGARSIAKYLTRDEVRRFLAAQGIWSTDSCSTEVYCDLYPTPELVYEIEGDYEEKRGITEESGFKATSEVQLCDTIIVNDHPTKSQAKKLFRAEYGHAITILGMKLSTVLKSTREEHDDDIEFKSE